MAYRHGLVRKFALFYIVTGYSMSFIIFGTTGEYVTSIKSQCIGIYFPNILCCTNSMASEDQIVMFFARLMPDLQATAAAGDFRSSL